LDKARALVGPIVEGKTGGQGERENGGGGAQQGHMEYRIRERDKQQEIKFEVKIEPK
jgi:hypothetical protein